MQMSGSAGDAFAQVSKMDDHLFCSIARRSDISYQKKEKKEGEKTSGQNYTGKIREYENLTAGKSEKEFSDTFKRANFRSFESFKMTPRGHEAKIARRKIGCEGKENAGKIILE